MKKSHNTGKKKYPIIDVPPSGNEHWSGGAYSLLFVYSKHKGNFIIRGYLEEAKNFLKKNYTHYFYYNSMWCRGVSRGYWSFWKDNVGFFPPSRRTKDRKYVVRTYSNSFYEKNENKNKIVELKFKRIPRRWIPEFDKF